VKSLHAATFWKQVGLLAAFGAGAANVVPEMVALATFAVIFGGLAVMVA